MTEPTPAYTPSRRAIDAHVRRLIQPNDDHDRRLLDNVHPASWANPEPADRYNLVVIGGGTAGLVSAMGAAALGARVALVERHLLGGDRLRTSNRRSYAAGDVCSSFKFTHAADAMARVVLKHALFSGRQKASSFVLPWATYTDPEVAHAGVGLGRIADTVHPYPSSSELVKRRGDTYIRTRLTPGVARWLARWLRWTP